MECPACRGKGFVTGTRADHAGDKFCYDGTHKNCPIKVRTKNPCSACEGTGEVEFDEEE